ncbi:aconitase X catalytic domain-containing protein [Brevibacterium daeguense]|uniref:Aconitase X catalytic domain-containing protein n=1 Tax=Brevibacterium daeguense TaxID=909936 RepID=A0ABP8EIA3_9MICO
MTLRLTREQQAMLDGEHGPAVAMAMRMVVGIARVKRAERLVQIAHAHIDSCLYLGRSGIDFARKLVDLGGQCRVRATTNVGSVDLIHPGIRPRSEELRTHGAELMELYRRLGVEETWTCAPYQLPVRPGFGEHVAWAESNAIVFANSVLGARTDRYGDFLDICAAITGLVPLAGLHLDEHRRADLHVDCSGVDFGGTGFGNAADLTGADFSGEHVYPLLGYLVGGAAGNGVPVLTGVPADVGEDELKAFGAAAASSGGVGLFHIVGVTPEAPNLADVCDPATVRTVRLRNVDLEGAQRELSTVEGRRRIDAVSLGTPHASLAELRQLAAELRRHQRAAQQPGAARQPGPAGQLKSPGRADGKPRIPIWVNTARSTLHALEVDHPDDHSTLRQAEVTILTDTCNYLTPFMADSVRVVMTNSAKWAHYAPGNIGVDVVFASLRDCVAEAVAG